MSTTPSSLKLNPSADPTFEIVPAWKHELNERLAATRARRTRKPEQQSLLPHLEYPAAKSESRAARLAARVAERYANAPSYSEMLAVEARAAADAAEVAMTAAREACAAAQALLAGIEDAESTASSPGKNQPAAARDEIATRSGPEESLSQRQEADEKSLRRLAYSSLDGAHDLESVSTADPVDEALVSPAQPLPVNLIEFPRELVATRKARPRLAEGPLRENSEEMAHDQKQLRIFEVEREYISTAAEVDSAIPEWSSIRLDAKPSSMPPNTARVPSLELPLKAAPIEDRLMAGIFDVGLVLLAFLLFVLVFAACTAHPPVGKSALSAAGLVLVGLFLLYQYLFFRFTEGTPGMRYAKIALCTFDDENPTRKAMRRRILFLLLSAAPFGLGLAWAWFDADRLGWHDRMTRMYQRSYR